MSTVDVVIPSTNSLNLLKKHLPSILKYTPGLKQLILVDNASTDNTIEFARSLSTKIKIIKNRTNNRYTKAVNQGVSASTADFVVLLNNDVQVEKDYLKDALPHFQDQNVFAVTLNEVSSSYPVVTFDGKFQYARSTDKSKAGLSAWASGGSAIFRRSTWVKLGGYNEMYSPGYWEDIDLGWTAWRSGYKIIFEPKAICHHQHESSFGQLSPSYINLIRQRNELLFNWQHFLDGDFTTAHIKYLFFYTLFHPGYLRIVISALLRSYKIKKLPKNLLSSKQIINLLHESA